MMKRHYQMGTPSGPEARPMGPITAKITKWPVNSEGETMELLTSQELCTNLKISRATLQRYILAGMPHLGDSRLRRFSCDDVLH